MLAVIGFAAFAAGRGAASPLEISPEERNWEVQVGQQQYATYFQRGKIVPRQSPLYGVLDPIANAIASVANSLYYAPFRFVLLNAQEPNAFSMPGGDVYVTVGMLSYLRNRDELAGVICHEVSHDIHHDMYNVYQAAKRGAPPVAYERAAEKQADRDGAYICAKAGFNPWGMVWNMRLHRGVAQSQQIAASLDHPSDAQRLAGLSALLYGDRATFGRFRDDVTASTPLANPRLSAQPGYGATGNQAWYPMQYSQPNAGQSPPQTGPYPPPPPPPCYPGC